MTRACGIVLAHSLLYRNGDSNIGTAPRPLLCKVVKYNADSPDLMPAHRPALCLNMIVRNESTIIERCLAATLPAIAAWVICDTGSTDDTPERIQRFFAERGILGELHTFAFESFEQARNEAMRRARTASLEFDYLLLADADMELVIEDPGFAEGLSAHSYALRQQNDVSYFNTRLVQRDAPARYVGVTHEYLDTG